MMKTTADNFFKLAATLTKIKLSPEEEKRCLDLLQNLEANLQSVFFDYCKKWKVAPWLYTQMKNRDWLKHFTQPIQEAFAAIHQKVQQENENRNAEAVLFLREFKRRGIEVALLKGNLLLHTTYHDSGYKKMNDFDILIDAEDWPKAQQVYEDLGYIPLGFGWSGEKEKPAKFSHVGMSFISKNYHCIIGTQWGLKSPSSRYTVDIAEAWENTLPFDFYGVPVRQLSPEYNLLHLILHMGIYKCGIRDCMDVHNLYLSQSHWDEARLLTLFEQSNASAKAYFTLYLTNLCSGVISPSLLEKLKPQTHGYLARRLEARRHLFEQSGDFQEAYHDYFQEIEINLFYFNLFPKFHHKLYHYGKILKLIFWPRFDIARRLSDLPKNASMMQKLKAWAKAPLLVFSLIAEEIGWTFTILLFFKLFVDLLISLKNYIFPQESYFAYLKKRGIDPADIQRAVKNIQ